ncbi:MAG: carbohydrate kinase family protein [Syntrophobacterales bacterium]|jgi:ribokinase
MKRHVVCLGAVNLDLLYQVNDMEGFLAAWGTGLARGGEAALSPEDEQRLQALLPSFAKPSGRSGGGQAANAAYVLSRLQVPVVLLGRVGADDDGAYLKESLAGVNLDHLVTQGESGRAYILMDAEGERTMLLAPNTNDRLTEADLPLEVVADSAFIHVTSFPGDGPFKVQQRILQRLAGDLRVCFDPGELYARRGREALADILDQTETLFVTEKEWHLLGGALRGHIDWAPPVVLVKRGAKGSRLLTPVRYLDFPPYVPKGPVDTLGAGDVFAAGYIAGLFQGLNLPQAVRLASALAAFALRGPGRESYPDRKVMDAIVSSLR